MPYITDNFQPESFYQGFSEPDSGAFDDYDEPEEQICLRCLELVEECQCDYYDKIEEVELARERAEIAMNKIKPIKIKVREMKKITI